VCTRVTTRAFSLLELLIVLALLGMIAALVAPAALRMSLGDPRDTDVAKLTESLAAARLDALREGASAVVRLEGKNGELAASWTDQRIEWSEWRLTIVDDTERAMDTLQMRFAATGRADRRDIRLLEPDTGRMWRIEFDPVSGVPSWRRIEDGAD
jgi:prepilin-type N-terminal cleavage/methylation domain-containing protein